MARLPSGGEERIFISPDKSLKTVRTEMHTKRAKDVLAPLYPQHTFYAQRRDGVVAARYKPIVKLDVHEDGTTLLFNETVLQEIGIDKGDANRAWEQHPQVWDQPGGDPQDTAASPPGHSESVGRAAGLAGGSHGRLQY